MASHSSVPARKTPWTEEPGGLQPKGYLSIRIMEQTFQESRNHPSGQTAHFSFACTSVMAHEISAEAGGAPPGPARKCESLDVTNRVGSFLFVESMVW